MNNYEKLKQFFVKERICYVESKLIYIRKMICKIYNSYFLITRENNYTKIFYFDLKPLIHRDIIEKLTNRHSFYILLNYRIPVINYKYVDFLELLEVYKDYKEKINKLKEMLNKEYGKFNKDVLETFKKYYEGGKNEWNEKNW